MNVLHLMRVSTKILATLAIFFHESKVSAVPVLFFPLLAYLLSHLCWRPLLNDSETVGKEKEHLMTLMHSTTRHKTLINDYMQRPVMQEWMAIATTRLQQ